jgi:glycogen debranching enzyme
MESLKKCTKVIVNLFEHGASYVEIGDTGIKVSKKEYEQIIGYNSHKQNQIIQLINNISTNININNKTIIYQVLTDIKNIETNRERVKEAEKNLRLLLKETQKKKPRWNVIKNIFKWALDFGKDVFIQLIPVLLQMSKRL